MVRLSTPLTELLGIQHPIILAGMAKVSNPDLAAAVSNAGGLGVIGGVMKTASQMKQELALLKSLLATPSTPFGVDLLLPQVGGSARKTNTDYTKGNLAELIDVIIEAKPTLFVAAVGVPPVWAVKKLHAAGILVQNMIGHPKHVSKALAVGVDLICAQGWEAGGHTGEIATSVLIPQVVDACKGRVSPLTGGPVLVVAAGGIFDGRGLASALSLGASGVWVGTRFICAEESGAPPVHQKAVIENASDATIRTTIYSGRPLRALRNKHNTDWENRAEEVAQMQAKGIVVYQNEVRTARAEGKEFDFANTFPMYVGQGMGGIHEIKPAKEIVEEMVRDAAATIQTIGTFVLAAPQRSRL